MNKDNALIVTCLGGTVELIFMANILSAELSDLERIRQVGGIGSGVSLRASVSLCVYFQ